MTNFSPKDLSYFIQDIEEWGAKVDSERGATREVENEVLSMNNPLDRVCTEEWRKMNIGFAITDAIQHIVGDDSLAPLTQFVPGFSKYSTNGRTIDGAYGKRFHANEQLDKIIMMLRKDPMTRRAVLSVYMGPVDLWGGGGLNTPCTLNFHFLVRDEKLNMKVMMRSNDVILGLTNDVFTFTMLHEYISSHVEIPIGDYTHFASSLHLYESDLSKYKPIHGGHWNKVMHAMPFKWDPKPLYDALIHLNVTLFEDACSKTFSTHYDQDLYFASAVVFYRKQDGVREMWQSIGDETLKRVAGFWIGE
jgi:thymidylate synthase